MHSLNLSRRSVACFVLVTLTAALTACNPAVSDIDLNAARSRAQAGKGRIAKLDSELKALNGEVKALTGFSGPEHEARMKQAEVLRNEKSALEAIKVEVDSKVARFTAEAKAHCETLAREKP